MWNHDTGGLLILLQSTDHESFHQLQVLYVIPLSKIYDVQDSIQYKQQSLITLCMQGECLVKQKAAMSFCWCLVHGLEAWTSYEAEMRQFASGSGFWSTIKRQQIVNLYYIPITLRNAI